LHRLIESLVPDDEPDSDEPASLGDAEQFGESLVRLAKKLLNEYKQKRTKQRATDAAMVMVAANFCFLNLHFAKMKHSKGPRLMTNLGPLRFSKIEDDWMPFHCPGL